MCASRICDALNGATWLAYVSAYVLKLLNKPILNKPFWNKLWVGLGLRMPKELVQIKSK